MAKVTTEQMSADQVINLISDSLVEMDGEAVAEVANSFLSCNIEYVEDSIFNVEWKDD